jgi:hypothetical protein
MRVWPPVWYRSNRQQESSRRAGEKQDSTISALHFLLFCCCCCRCFGIFQASTAKPVTLLYMQAITDMVSQ